MGVLHELLQLSAIDWFVVGLATFTCLVGALLPRFGNFIGRLAEKLAKRAPPQAN
jgi:hypothetical protein